MRIFGLSNKQQPVDIPSKTPCVNAAVRVTAGVAGALLLSRGAKGAYGMVRDSVAKPAQPADQTVAQAEVKASKFSGIFNRQVAKSAAVHGLEIAGGAALVAMSLKRA